MVSKAKTDGRETACKDKKPEETKCGWCHYSQYFKERLLVGDGDGLVCCPWCVPLLFQPDAMEAYKRYYTYSHTDTEMGKKKKMEDVVDMGLRQHQRCDNATSDRAVLTNEDVEKIVGLERRRCRGPGRRRSRRRRRRCRGWRARRAPAAGARRSRSRARWSRRC